MNNLEKAAEVLRKATVKAGEIYDTKTAANVYLDIAREYAKLAEIEKGPDPDAPVLTDWQ